MSRGMANLAEIKLAIKTLKENGCPQVALLHCVSSYPAKPAQMNLKTIPDLVKKFKVVAGLSDHSLDSHGGLTVPITAVALGAAIIEKHFTLCRADGGPDADFSLESDELRQLVKSVREAEQSLGRPTYGAKGIEQENIVFRRSLFAVKDIKKGEKLTPVNVRSIRPGNGLPPKYYERIIGRQAKVDIKRATPLKWSLIK